MSGGSLPIKKVYIDSRFKTNDSSSNSHFKYELVESLQLPDNTVCFIDDVIIPHSYFNVDENNNRLYVRQFNDLNSTVLDVPVVIDTNNHTTSTLVASIQNALNGAYGTNAMTVTFDSRKLTLTITENTGKSVKLFTDQELKSANAGGWTGVGFNASNLQSINELVGNYTAKQHATSFETGIVDLRRYHNIYISSPNLSSFSTLGPRGEGSIIKKIPVTTEYGFTIIDNVVAPHDWVDVSKLLLKHSSLDYPMLLEILSI